MTPEFMRGIIIGGLCVSGYLMLVLFVRNMVDPKYRGKESGPREESNEVPSVKREPSARGRKPATGSIMFAPPGTDKTFKLRLFCSKCGRSSSEVQYRDERCLCPCGNNMELGAS